MSHVAVVKIKILSLEALEIACGRLGLRFIRDQQHYKWYGRWVGDYRGRDAAVDNGIAAKDLGKCSHAIAIPDNSDAYEIGVVKNPNGEGFILAYDFWGPGRAMQAIVGEAAGRLVQEYGYAVAEMEADYLIQQGWQAERVEQPNGDICLELTLGGGGMPF